MCRCDTIGVNGVSNITVRTETCSQCAGSSNPLGYVEGGLSLHLLGDYDTSCQSNGLDNLEKVDYDNGMVTFFDGEIISDKHPFLTRKWDADEDVDKKHWVGGVEIKC